jgi:hypothetical protein
MPRMIVVVPAAPGGQPVGYVERSDSGRAGLAGCRPPGLAGCRPPGLRSVAAVSGQPRVRRVSKPVAVPTRAPAATSSG